MNVGYPVVRLLVAANELEMASADLWDFDTVGVEEVPPERATGEGWRGDGDDRVALQAGFSSVAQARLAAETLNGRWSPVASVITDDSWLDAWREHFEPFRVGRVVIVPSWKVGTPVEPRNGDLVIRLDPGRSFGTGAHPSTRLILELIQELTVAGARVLDVGCGSGILSVAAALLGSGPVTAVDVEEAAIPTTLFNAHQNGIVVAVSTMPIEEVDGEYDLVVANILAPVLIALAPAIAARLAPDGTLLLSGLIETQRDRVVAAYPNMRVTVERREPPWIGLAIQSVARQHRSHQS